MNTANSHSALREWRAHMAQPVRVLALFGVAIVLTLLAPFDTDESFRLLPRFVYWALLSFIAYTIGYVGNGVADHFAPDSGPWLRTLIAAPVTAFGVFALVIVLNYGFLGLTMSVSNYAFIGVNVLVISIVVAGIMQFAYHEMPDADTPIEATRPALLDRLPFDKRGPLVSISSEDHYIRVVTTKGDEMILMRLSDAMLEVGATQGLQVHRSHWVALDQVIAVDKHKDRAELTLTGGAIVPVSRSYLPALRDAKLL